MASHYEKDNVRRLHCCIPQQEGCSLRWPPKVPLNTLWKALRSHDSDGISLFQHRCNPVSDDRRRLGHDWVRLGIQIGAIGG